MDRSDATINGTQKQVLVLDKLYMAKKIGFNLHDTMLNINVIRYH
jgi:hypothetical protein